MMNIEELRNIMIEKHLKAPGVKNPDVLQAMSEVPGKAFLFEEMSEFAYEDSPLPIGQGQTISQPYIVAVMTELLEPSKLDRVLEIGTGPGYAAAILSRIVSEVYTVERYGALAETARNRFRRLGYENIDVLHSDGTLGRLEHAPYDAILVTAGWKESPVQHRSAPMTHSRPLSSETGKGLPETFPFGV
jgi:protein-L-isoaspartate(D-aspartate) O-methyltransferase